MISRGSSFYFRVLLFVRRLALPMALATLSAPALAPLAQAQIFGAILPQARATVTNGTVTAFATIINAGSQAATNCRVSVSDSTYGFQFQATNAFNQPVGVANIVMSGGK